ncbi:GYD domain-containing protein [Streptomyces rhizosphaericus]|uniref:GYD domain-containing protein n=1 Tax=Streptomyces rhizosphaericus TaxID=114699 RepID=A0A6G4APP1_9ACTN|nr:GYD domain-containing protein [Streptomyces rhizosphaericus]NEW74571.1 GYD domain-containing protein [Streptomyces rhizosphaericus]
MATYITLLNWTEQGVHAFRDTTQRSEDYAEALGKLGARLVDIYWTDGPYDLVCIIEAPDDETATAASLQLSALGNVRTTTLRAFGREDMGRIIAKVPG